MRYDYDAVVIGGGAAGLTASGIAANFGAKTIMIERDRLGGDCTWTGCIPSKSLIKAASVIHGLRQAGGFGLGVDVSNIDTAGVMKHVDDVRKEVYKDADRPEIFEEMGIEVVFGSACFADDHTIDITSGDGNTRTITGKYIFICSGARAAVPPISGLQDVEYLTNETLFEIENLPSELAVVGAGPIGTEMAQSFQRLGTDVHLLDLAPGILPNDDPELSIILQKKMEEEGVTFHLNASVTKVQNKEDGIELMYKSNGVETRITSGALLIAAGRVANTESLNLDAAGVNVDKSGIQVNDKCRTNVRHIYAAGDVTGRYQFTHMSDHMAKVAVTNALIKVPMKVDSKHVPWVTFTDPEIGHVGATEEQLKEEGVSYETYRLPYCKIDRAVTDGVPEGLIKIYGKKWSGKILGASAAGAHAGEIISQYALAMRNGVSLRDFADTIHPYPTYGLGARRAADQWYIKNQSETLVKWIKRIFGYRGEIPDYSDPDRIV